MKSFVSLAQKKVPKKLLAPAYGLRRKYLSAVARPVRLDRLLLGGEGKIPARKYARLTQNLRRPSTPLSQSPHVRLLELYDEIGDDLFGIERLKQTEYYANARESIGLFGNYIGCRSDEDLIRQVRFFVHLYQGEGEASAPTEESRSRGAFPPLVRPVRDSGGYYEIVDGHHRLAAAYCRGEGTAKVAVAGEAVHTPLQQLLLDGLWTQNERILYQPVDAPEVQAEWPLVRKCSDRAEKMLRWLERNGPDKPRGETTYLDLGSNYGWFVKHMLDQGYDSRGVERDICAIEIGKEFYGLDPRRIQVQELVSFLEGTDSKFDLVSCFSVLHHFALGKAVIGPEDFFRHLDRITGSVLFFDTGQAHEAWFRVKLKDWTPEFIQDWILRNSTFTGVEPLGPDEDARPPHQDNYGRMLFACTRG